MPARRWPFLRTLDPCPITLVDVGAADELPSPWARIASSDLHVVAFEPDDRSPVNSVGKVTKIAAALGHSASSATLHLVRKPQCSSLYLPNMELLRRYPDADRFEVVETADLQLDRLDVALERAGVRDVDAMKLDVQGAELDVLRGAGPILDDLLVLDIEVEFLAVYLGQPLFFEVDEFLRGAGFVLVDLRPIRWRRADVPPFWGSRGGGEIAFANCVYFKDPEQLPGSAEKLERAIALALLFDMPNHAYHIGSSHRAELGARAPGILHELARRGRSNLPRRALRKGLHLSRLIRRPSH